MSIPSIRSLPDNDYLDKTAKEIRAICSSDLKWGGTVKVCLASTVLNGTEPQTLTAFAREKIALVTGKLANLQDKPLKENPESLDIRLKCIKVLEAVEDLYTKDGARSKSFFERIVSWFKGASVEKKAVLEVLNEAKAKLHEFKKSEILDLLKDGPTTRDPSKPWKTITSITQEINAPEHIKSSSLNLTLTKTAIEKVKNQVFLQLNAPAPTLVDKADSLITSARQTAASVASSVVAATSNVFRRFTSLF